MTKGKFDNIGNTTNKAKNKPKTVPEGLEEFADKAKVDGNTPRDPLVGLNPAGRRGKRYKDSKTGDVIQLKGKVQELPLNEYELTVVEMAASKSGLSLTAYMRGTALATAKASLNLN